MQLEDVKSLSQSKKQNCISEYTEEEINDLKKSAKELSVHKKKLWKEKNKEHEAEYQHQKYQENRDNIISQRIMNTKTRYKENTIKEHENDLNKYKEQCENFAIEKNNEKFSKLQQYFKKKIEKLKQYIDEDRIEHVQKEFDCGKFFSPESLTIALMLAENEDSAINRWMKKTSLY